MLYKLQHLHGSTSGYLRKTKDLHFKQHQKPLLVHGSPFKKYFCKRIVLKGIADGTKVAAILKFMITSLMQPLEGNSLPVDNPRTLVHSSVILELVFVRHTPRSRRQNSGRGQESNWGGRFS